MHAFIKVMPEVFKAGAALVVFKKLVSLAQDWIYTEMPQQKQVSMIQNNILSFQGAQSHFWHSISADTEQHVQQPNVTYS